MAKLEPLDVTTKPCPECGSSSTTLESGHYNPEDGCLYDDYHCDACGQNWAEKLICDGDVEGLEIIDISGDDDTDDPMYPADYPDYDWDNLFPPPDED